LWQKAEAGEITTLPGVGTAYEPPPAPEVAVDTAEESPEASTSKIWRYLDERVLSDG
jgi:bifunctional enzyme CysN/CysC